MRVETMSCTVPVTQREKKVLGVYAMCVILSAKVEASSSSSSSFFLVTNAGSCRN